jgi:hypothetical protein
VINVDAVELRQEQRVIPNRSLAGKLLVMLVLFASIAVPSTTALAADGRVHLISTTLSGGELDMKDGKVVGSYAMFFNTVAKLAGIEINYRLVPWARAAAETEQSNSLLLFPLTRTAARENRFTWVSQLGETPMCFASADDPVNTIEEARKRKRVLVWRGSSHQEYMETQGLKNLVLVDNIKKIARILANAPDSAWYYLCDQVQSFLNTAPSDIKLTIGAPVSSETTWLAGGKSLFRTPAINKFSDSASSLIEKGVLNKLMTGSNQ